MQASTVEVVLAVFLGAAGWACVWLYEPPSGQDLFEAWLVRYRKENR